MLRTKPMSFRVSLDNAAGSVTTMTVLGCINEEECVIFVTKSKQKDQKIMKIEKINRFQ